MEFSLFFGFEVCVWMEVGVNLKGEQQVFFLPFFFSLLIHIADSSRKHHDSLSQTGSCHRRSEYKRLQVTVGHLYSLPGAAEPPGGINVSHMACGWAE